MRACPQSGVLQTMEIRRWNAGVVTPPMVSACSLACAGTTSMTPVATALRSRVTVSPLRETVLPRGRDCALRGRRDIAHLNETLGMGREIRCGAKTVRQRVTGSASSRLCRPFRRNAD